MKLAICGSRDLSIESYQINSLISALSIVDGFYSEPIEIVSGGAKGIDLCAYLFARDEEYKFTEFLADWDQFGKSAGPKRNRQIAEYSDKLLVIRLIDSKGSISVANEFRKLNKPVFEIIVSR